MTARNYRLVTVFFLIMSSLCQAENWRTIEQPTYRLIFPDTVESEAQRVAAKLDAYLSAHQQPLPLTRKPEQVPVVLLTDTHIANGNVNLMPYRSLWYNTPGAFARLEWYDALAVHEGRHVVQYNQIFQHPVGKMLHLAMGDLGTGALLFLFVPQWYMEGDAVVSETVLTQGGRGRVASFDLWLRTDMLTNTPYSYIRAMLGTGFDRIPSVSPYVLGYYLAGQAEMDHGEQIFAQTMQDMATSFSSFSFNAAFKAQTGQTLDTHYQKTVAKMQGYWQQQLDELTLSPVNDIAPTLSSHWRSVYPLAMVSDDIVALQVDVKEGSSLVVVTENGPTEKLTAIPASVAHSYLSGSKDRQISRRGSDFCWIADHDHPTRKNVSYGELECWSKAGGLQRLTHGEKLTMATAVNEGFIAHRFTRERESQLVQLDSTGHELAKWALPRGSLATDIFVGSERIVFVLNGTAEDGIYQLNPAAGQPQPLLLANEEVIRSPLLTQHWLVFSSDRSGIDQLYAMSLLTRQVYQIVTRPYGAYFPLHDSQHQRLIFSDYTPTGQRLVSIPFPDLPEPSAGWIAAADISRSEPFIASLLSDPLPIIDENPNFPVEPYQPGQHLWNPHSWRLSAGTDGVSALVYSTDILEKLSSLISAGYDTEESEYWGSVQADYRLDAGPIIGSSVSLTSAVDWNAGLSLSQPIRWTKGIWEKSLELATGAESSTDDSNLLFIKSDYSSTYETPIQAIAPPLDWHQALYADLNDKGQHRLYSISKVVGSPSASTSLAAQLQWQQRQNAETLLKKTEVFSALERPGVSYRYQLDARWNPGAVDLSLSSMLYLGSLEYGLHWAGQQQDGEDTQQAAGLSLAPSINLFRNSRLKLQPEFAWYYRLDDSSNRFAIKLILEGD